MLNLFKRQGRELKNEKDRSVYEIHTTFQTILGETVSYTSFCKLDDLLNGIISFKELELLNDYIHVGDVTYNTNQIVTLKSEVKKKRLVRKDVKNNYGVKWEYKRYFSENELE